MNLDYVFRKIEDAQFVSDPFRHIEIDGLIEPEHFRQLVESPEIATDPAPSNTELLASLLDRGYRVLSFPGCTEDYEEYVRQLDQREVLPASASCCESTGVALRLDAPVSDAVRAVRDLIQSREFIECIAAKFAVDLDKCRYDAGIQKYLDGYEISPHPDVRSKALTYMVNINPNPESEQIEHHTSYLRFDPRFRYMGEFWRGNEDVERFWVPWHWCVVTKQQRRNNSLIMFSPSDDSLHAVRARYDHLRYQRTQLYGNLWYENPPKLPGLAWEDFDFRARLDRGRRTA